MTLLCCASVATAVWLALPAERRGVRLGIAAAAGLCLALPYFLASISSR